MHPSGTCIQVCLAPRRFRIAIPCYPNAPFSIRVHRIMRRLQNVALALSAKTNCLNDGGRARNAERGEKKQSERETFFFERFCRLLAH